MLLQLKLIQLIEMPSPCIRRMTVSRTQRACSLNLKQERELRTEKHTESGVGRARLYIYFHIWWWWWGLISIFKPEKKRKGKRNPCIAVHSSLLWSVSG